VYGLLPEIVSVRTAIAWTVFGGRSSSDLRTMRPKHSWAMEGLLHLHRAEGCISKRCHRRNRRRPDGWMCHRRNRRRPDGWMGGENPSLPPDAGTAYGKMASYDHFL